MLEDSEEEKDEQRYDSVAKVEKVSRPFKTTRIPDTQIVRPNIVKERPTTPIPRYQYSDKLKKV